MPTPVRRRLRLARRGLGYAVAVALVCVALVVGLASQVLPLAERHPQRIAAWLSERAGQPVRFDRVEAQWSRRGPLLRFDGLRVGAGEGVRIGQAELLVSMYSGLLPGSAFSELRLRGLSLTLERAGDGSWAVRGLPGRPGGDPLAGLQRLGELQVIDGQLAILAPSLGWDVRLPQIDLRVQVHGERIRAGARVRARRGGAPLRVAADFDRQRGDGRIYVEAAPADLKDWSALARLAGVSLETATGRASAWAEMRQHRVVQVASDLQLSEVALRGLPLPGGKAPARVDFEQLQGRMRWQALADGGWRLDAPVLRMGSAHAPQRLDGLTVAGGERYAMLAERIDAAPLLQVVALSDRLSPGLRRWLLQARPDVRLARLSLAGRRGGPLQAEGRLQALSMAAVGRAPGFSGLAGDFSGDAEGFTFVPDARQALRFDWPSGFGVAHEVTLEGNIAGWREGAGWRVATPALQVRGKDVGVDVRGGVWFQGDGNRPRIDLAADIGSAPVLAAKGFWIRHSMPKVAVDWLDAALQGGWVHDGRAIVSGDLDDWPFAANNGRFEARARVEQAKIAFRPGWPAVEKLDGEVVFLGNGFSVEGTGDLAGVPIGRIQGGIDNYRGGALNVQASADTDAARLLALLRSSPLQASHGQTLDSLSASGPAAVGFDLHLPLRRSERERTRIGGTVELRDAKLADKRYDLALEQVRGQATYSTAGFQAPALSVVRQGRPGQLGLWAGDGVRDIAHAFEGRLSLPLDSDELLQRVPDVAWLKEYVEGRSEWTIGVDIAKETAAAARTGEATGAASSAAARAQGNVSGRVTLQSDLVGTALKLPAPLDKPAPVALPTRVGVVLPTDGGQVEVAFGQLLALRTRSVGGQTGVRVQLGSDRVAEAPPAAGLVVSGRTPVLDGLDWVAVARRLRSDAAAAVAAPAGPPRGVPAGASNPAAAPRAPLALRSIDVTADRLRLLGSEFPDTRVQLSPANAALAVKLDGPALAGTLSVPDAETATLSGQLARVYWRAAPGSVQAAAAPAAPASAAPPIAMTPAPPAQDEVDPASVPPLALDIADLRFGDAQLGAATLRTERLPAGLRIRQLQTRAEGQKIDIDGDWTGRGAAASTRLNARIDSRDYGSLLDALGFSGRLRSGTGVVTANVRWPGSPAAFALARVEGQVDADVRNGQLLEVEPGAGRVLGLLSLTQLPRRILLDFRDFFSKGFAFNQLKGRVAFGQGQARSDDLLIDGPAAEIQIRGATDLRAQQFDQTIQVLPRSGNLLTVVGAVAGGPVGAAVGAAANAVLGKPLGAFGAKTYRVTGPWKDPKVEVTERGPEPAPTAPAPARAPAASLAPGDATGTARALAP